LSSFRETIDKDFGEIHQHLKALDMMLNRPGNLTRKYLVGDSVTVLDYLMFSQLTDMLALRRSFGEFKNVIHYFSIMLDVHTIEEHFGEESDWRLNILPMMSETLTITGLADYEDEQGKPD
jgi:glutathione S-transferase